jgi:hypothetical protein
VLAVVHPATDGEPDAAGPAGLGVGVHLGDRLHVASERPRRLEGDPQRRLGVDLFESVDQVTDGRDAAGR